MNTHRPRTRSLIGALASAAILVVAMMAPALADHDDDHTDLQDAVADAQDAVDAAQDALDDFADNDDAGVYSDGKCSAAGGNKDLKDACDALVKALKDAKDDLADAIAALEAWEAANEGGSEDPDPQSTEDDKKALVCHFIPGEGNNHEYNVQEVSVNSQLAKNAADPDHPNIYFVDSEDECGPDEQSNPVNDENNDTEETTTSSSSSSSSSDDEPAVLAEVLEADDEAVVMGETLAFTGASTPTLGGFGLALLAAGAWILRRNGVAASA